jgi:peptidoglycan/xylan/chitin deacetylase (PgdA/CDA1 family)
MAFVSFLLLAPGVLAQQPAPEEPSWKWPESRWRAAVDKVRAGKRLLPTSWPDGAKVAVALSFDSTTRPSLSNGQTLPSLLSTGEYGSRSALPRVLSLLERYEIPSTFFIPGVAAKLYPEDVKRIAAAGHEIGIHGWIHEWTSSLARDEERMLMERSLATIEELTGKKPVGIRTGSWEYSANTAADPSSGL